MTRAAWAAAAVCVLTLLVPPAAAAKTSVSVSGTVVKITVPIAMRGMLDETFRNLATGERADSLTVADVMEAEIESIWNDGLAEHPYAACFTLRVDVEITPEGSRASAEGRHLIDYSTDPQARSFVIDPATTNPNDDTPSAFTDSLSGSWGPPEVGTWTHEVGHLLGLGDDYVHGGKGKAVSPEREGTLMHDSDEGGITAELVARIVDLIRATGVKLPECWKGQWREGNDAMRSTGEFTLTVTPEGKVDGKGTGTQVVTSGGSASYDVEVAGARQGDRFNLRFIGEGGALDVAATIDGARAQGPWRTGSGQAAYRGELTMQCVSCPPDG